MKPKISFVMPNRNKAPFIPEAIRTTLKQTMKDIEIVFVDDDSNDDSLDIIRSFMKRDDRIRLILPGKIGRGTPEAIRVDRVRNIGNYHAKAEIICPMDSEDWCVPKRAEITYKTLKDNPDCKLFYGAYAMRDMYGNKDSKFPDNNPTVPFSKERLKKTGLFFIGHNTLGYYKRLAIQYPYDSKCGVGDWGFLYLWLIRNNFKFCYTDEILGTIRVSNKDAADELSWDEGWDRVDYLWDKKQKKMEELGDLCN
jgi:glycosyltransferase involved in cell wall biosynthesis